jgi:hypothetical protein
VIGEGSDGDDEIVFRVSVPKSESSSRWWGKRSGDGQVLVWCWEAQAWQSPKTRSMCRGPRKERTTKTPSRGRNEWVKPARVACGDDGRSKSTRQFTDHTLEKGARAHRPQLFGG